jgi:hypothetical protein
MKLRYLAMVALIFVTLVPAMLNAQQTLPASSRPEEIEWTWEVRPTHLDSKLPNVLLIGDSISRNYYPEVQRQLASVANVYLFAASTSLGDPRLLHQLAEFASMEDVQFQVVHFNNGMHGWTYSEEEYKSAFPDYIREIRQIAPAAKLIWATTTPVKADSSSGPTNPGPTNARVDRRNSIAVAVMKKAGITIDDQNSLMTHHTDTYEDNVHFALAGSTIQGRQAAGSIRNALGGNAQ